jgi:hypothetical protein
MDFGIRDLANKELISIEKIAQTGFFEVFA